MFKTRALTTILILPLFIVALLWLDPLYWGLLVYMMILFGAWEWADMAGFNKPQALLYIMLFSALILPILFFNPLWGGIFNVCMIILAAIFWIVFVPLWLKFQFVIRHKAWLALLGVIAILPTWFALATIHQSSPVLLLMLLAAVWIADIAAYLIGKRFGKNKLAPRISPGKTWEGAYAAMMAVALYACGLSWWLHMGGEFVMLLLAVAVFSIIGDLFESLVKRQSGVKDSGDIFPGHGGMLDRVDGVLAALPVANFIFIIPLLMMLATHHA
jgi:phosphatidate cytidylyltransferase